MRGEEEVDFRFTVIQSAMWLEKERGAGVRVENGAIFELMNDFFCKESFDQIIHNQPNNRQTQMLLLILSRFPAKGCGRKSNFLFSFCFCLFFRYPEVTKFSFTFVDYYLVRS